MDSWLPWTIFPPVLVAALRGPGWIRPPSRRPLCKRVIAPPNFAFVLDDGSYATLDDLKGRPVLINFWATWCGPCRLELPELVKAAQENEDLVVLAVNMQEARSAVEPFAQEFDMTMPVVLDADGRLRMEYLVRGLPTTYFVDREGKIASVVAGPLTPKILADRLAEIR